MAVFVQSVGQLSPYMKACCTVHFQLPGFTTEDIAKDLAPLLLRTLFPQVQQVQIRAYLDEIVVVQVPKTCASDVGSSPSGNCVFSLCTHEVCLTFARTVIDHI